MTNSHNKDLSAACSDFAIITQTQISEPKPRIGFFVLRHLEAIVARNHPAIDEELHKKFPSASSWQQFFREIDADINFDLNRKPIYLKDYPPTKDDQTSLSRIQTNILSKWRDWEKAEAHPKLAWACYFWAHSCSDAELRNAAQRIDIDLIGKRFESAFGEPVPIDANSASALLEKTEIQKRSKAGQRKPLPFEKPQYVSEELAFKENPANAAWLNPHNHYSIPLVGRERETNLLDEFMTSSEPFKIAALVGPSGAGKTRLVSERSRQYFEGDKSGIWDAGLAKNTDAHLWNADNWKPSRNTLIVVDYTYSFASVIGLLIDRFKNKAPHKIRLLVLDHVLPERLHEDIAWRQGVPDLKFREGREELFFRHWPIHLRPADDDPAFLSDVIAAAADPYSSVKRFNRNSPRVVAATDALMSTSEQTEAATSHEKLRTRNAVRHPLFAALVGQLIYKDRDEELVGMSRRDLVGHYFSSARRLPWLYNSEDSNLGYWAGLYVSVATLVRGLSLNGIHEFHDNYLDEYKPRPIGENFENIMFLCGRIVSSSDAETIKPFEPDILGESFLSKFLSKHRGDNDLRTLGALLETSCRPDTEQDNVNAFLGTIQRLVRNLINDDQDLHDVKEAWNSLHRFLNPSLFQAGGEIRQAVSIALGDIIKQRREAGHQDMMAAYALNIDAADLVIASENGKHIAAVRTTVHAVDCLLASDQLSQKAAGNYALVADNFKNKSEKGWLTSMVATVEGCAHALQYFKRELNEDINANNDDGWTIIMMAAFYNRCSIIEWLINSGAVADLTYVAGQQTAFHIACKMGHLEAAKTLKQHGADIHSVDQYGQNAAIFASQNGHLAVLKWLRSQNVDIHKTNNNGESALIHASYCGHIALIKWLNDEGIDMHAVDRRVQNAITAAAAGGKLECIKWLRGQGVKIQPKNIYRSAYTCTVSAAILGGHIDVLKWLHDQDEELFATEQDAADAVWEACKGGNLVVLGWLEGLNISVNPNGEFPSGLVLEICERGHLEVLQWLYTQGADIHEQDNYGNAVCHACSGGKLDVLKWLHAQEVDLHVVSFMYENAAMYASSGGNLEVLKWLHSKGVDIHFYSRFAGNAAIAASKEGHLHVLKWLYDQQVDIHVENELGYNTAIYASAGGHFSALKWLHAKNVNIHRVEVPYVRDPVLLASQRGHLAVLNWLHENGAEIHSTDDYGNNAVLLASKGGHVNTLKWLYSNGVDIHAKNDERQNAVMLATESGRLAVLELLLEWGVDFNARARKGFNVVTAARRGGHPHIIKWLRDKSIDVDLMWREPNIFEIILIKCLRRLRRQG